MASGGDEELWAWVVDVGFDGVGVFRGLVSLCLWMVDAFAMSILIMVAHRCLWSLAVVWVAMAVVA